MEKWRNTYIVLTALVLLIAIFSIIKDFPKDSLAAVCSCVRYEYYTCEGNAGCKPCPGSAGCAPGAVNRCTAGVCIRCAEQRCEQTETAPRPQPTTPPPTATPKPVVACVDTDGGSVPNVYGEVRTSAPALAQVLKDTCLTNVVTKNADGSTTSRWVSGETGTHVGEKTCTNITTGAYADKVLSCQYGCQSGACRASAVTPTPVITCMSRTDCPTGYRCYQPPMPTCPAGRMCPEVMPARYCVPDTCTLHSKGDANCDGVVNDVDYTIWKKLVQNPNVVVDGHSADFNSDRAVTIVDFEIWRATRHN